MKKILLVLVIISFTSLTRAQILKRITDRTKQRIEQKVEQKIDQKTFLGATALYKMGFSSEDDNQKQGAVDLGLKDVAAYETIYKDGSRAELALVIADRFFADIVTHGTNDADLVRSIAKSMKIQELASK